MSDLYDIVVNICSGVKNLSEKAWKMVCDIKNYMDENVSYNNSFLIFQYNQ